MKFFLKRIQCILLLLLTVNVFGQTDRLAVQIRNDPDWQIIYNNNADFLSRLMKQSYTLSELWGMGQENFLLLLNYSREEYYQRRMETRDAAARLLNKYPALNMPGNCNPCQQTDLQLTGKVDAFVGNLKVARTADATAYLREIVSDDGSGPQCGWRFYACVIVCAGTIEAFPVYLACCALCLCEFCKNPPAWCQ